MDVRIIRNVKDSNTARKMNTAGEGMSWLVPLFGMCMSARSGNNCVRVGDNYNSKHIDLYICTQLN